MSDFTPYLQILGLNEEQESIFNLLVETGERSILDIARETGIPRTTIYLYIPILENEGLLKCIDKGKKKVYLAVRPSALLTLLKRKQEEVEVNIEHLKKNLSELEAVYHEKGKSKITLYSGKNGAKDFFERIFSEPKIYMLLGSATRSALSIEIEYLFDRVGDALGYAKEIVLDDASGRHHKKTHKSARHEIKLMPGTHETTSDTIVAGSHVATIVYSDEPRIIVMTDPQVAHSEIVKFLHIWEHLPA